ncbi:indolepyruvate ferredoxin oxidoreductase subunit alpha [Eubacterium maltosivorans]|uniref:Indolepyruvate oxidoreductase subunit IorA n=1 Tax=Eubacterium maltosivorans TaxID=2041044 RepID=A0A4P9C6R8_EUBML|nr:indolepyruvate ferredoxin oxidoreductase subunit alpha [Eubacterium maltosivorans]QCT70292.1 indolepyruvate ferredoxin oxidoreductase subunit alpha [Eubacterium maltosivorans]
MKKLLTGNEAIARGAWEAGVKFATAYPGTPSTEILENVATYDGIVSEWAPNEKVAVEAAAGASIAGIRTLAAMKHVGVNVAADPIFTFAYLGVNGGSVIVTADEPGMHSSQNEQDNRNYARHAKMPMFEPSDSQEAKDMLKEAYEVSETYDCPVLYRMTTRVCHSKSIVECEDRVEVDDKEYVKDIMKNCPLPAHARVMQVKLAKNFEKLAEYTETSKWNYIEDNQKEIGVIASGVAFRYAKEVFGDTASYLKLGFSYPLPKKLIAEFAGKVKKIYVLEENDPILETEIKAMGIDVIGKDVFPTMGELTPERIREALYGKSEVTLAPDPEKIVGRPPAFCAGCPHRGIFYELGRRKNIMIFSDIGCYSLGLTPPYNATDAMICMGASISGGHGVAKAMDIKNNDMKVVSVIGDSTFFHSGMTSLMDVTYNKSNVLTVILDNRITGMTGHQENPGSGFDLKGEPAPIMDIETIVRALGVKNVRTVDPNNLEETDAALDWGLSNDEASVIITRWPCALKRFSQADKEEFPEAFKRHCKVDTDLCIGCKKCLKSGCPALAFNSTVPKKSGILEESCLGCEVCLQICPKHAIYVEEEK